jgi:hypothetical protein
VKWSLKFNPEYKNFLPSSSSLLLKKHKIKNFVAVFWHSRTILHQAIKKIIILLTPGKLNSSKINSDTTAFKIAINT